MNRVILKLNKNYDPQDVSDILTTIFSEKKSFAEYKVDYFQKLCRAFEKRHRLSSDKFIKKFNRGKLGDEAVYFDWYAAKMGLDKWLQKLSILRGLSFSAN